MPDVITLAMANEYTKETIAGSGALKGDPGVGIATIVQTTTTSVSGGENIVTVTKTDSSKSTFSVFNGEKGERGEKGDKGENAYIVQNAEVYSLDETVIGTWIDGKPLYRKMIVAAAPTATAQGTSVVGTVEHGVSDVDFVARCTGTVEGDSYIFNTTYIGGNLASHGWIQLMYSKAYNTIEIKNAAPGYSELPVVITFEYTKTTDTATIDIPDAAAMNAAYNEGVQSA